MNHQCAMIADSYNDLKLLSVWTAPSKNDVAQFMHKMVADNADSTLYYIDATNRFPVKEFQGIVKPNSEAIYDRIRIITSLDLTEVTATVNKIVQVLNMDKVQRQQRQNSGDDTSPGEKRVQVLLILQGLEIMFRNTQLNCSPSESHLVLRNLLLRLRAIANTRVQDSTMLRTVVMFPREELFKFASRQGNDVKRLKGRPINGNTLGEYVAKFYADIVI